MIIYIASPYSGYEDKQEAVNAQIDAFAALRDAGHQPIAPLLSHCVDERHPASYERWMEWCKAMVSVADLVVRLPGESKGADAEVAEARRLGKPVVYGVESIVNPGEYHQAFVGTVDVAPYLIPADTPPLDPQKHIPADELAVKWFGREDDGAQIRQDYTWAEHQAANQATLDEIAAAVGIKR